MRFDNILFPVDFSDQGRAMNAEVEWLASRFNSHVTLLHVWEIPSGWYGGGLEGAVVDYGLDFVAYATAARERLKNYKLDVPENRIQRISAEGDPAWEISEWIKEHKVDLVVMGTHGHGKLSRLLLGSVALKVLHEVECPVWTRQSGGQPDPVRSVSRILCPLDMTEEALPLLRFLKGLADELGALVQLLHCVPEEETLPARYFDRDLHTSLKERAVEEISRLQHEAQTDFASEIGEAGIVQNVVEMAASQHSDLIVIGRGSTQGFFGTLKTHTFEIIRHAPCPVLSFAMKHN